MHDWAMLEAEYINDPTASTTTLSKKYGIPTGTLSCRMSRDKWLEKRQAKSLKIKEASIENATLTQIEKASQFCSADLKVSEAIREKIAQKLSEELTANELNSLSQAADKAQKIGRLALGLTTNNEGLTEVTDPMKELEEATKILKEQGINVQH